MKTPLTYYGGKQKLAPKIIQIMPIHKLYCEPFCGGAAVFFNKEPSKVEVLNDTNNELINFYKVVQRDYVSLEKEIMISLHSRDLHRKATTIYNNPDMFSELKRAWAIWVLANMSYCSKLDGSFGYDRTGTTSKKMLNKREAFTMDLSIRLQEVQLESADAIRIIKSRDTKDSFFYCDPPYFNSDMGHYDGYTIEDFTMLLEALTNIEGRFLLSSYPSPVLKEFIKRYNWCSIAFDMSLDVSKGKRRKTEMLSGNYEFSF